MLLEGMDTVAWSRLTCTVGTAQEVPEWLRQLTSPSAKMRRAALWNLSNDFVHQGTVWTAAVAAIPFLLELLAAPKVGSKDGLLELLTDIADGSYSGFDAAARRQERMAPTGSAVTRPVDGVGTPSVDDETGDGDQPQRTAIRAGIPVYLSLLDHSDPAVRLWAARLLARCGSPAFDPRLPLQAARVHE